MTAPLLALQDLSVRRGGALALDGLDLDVVPGEIVALLGLNGAGKSSLMRAVIGLEPVSGGRILLDGQDIARLAAADRARRGIGYCPEGRRLFPGMTVADTLQVALDAPAARRRARIAALAGLFPILADLLDRDAWSLSGGQQQVVAIARALMADPRLLLLDEPSLGLAPIVLGDLLPAIRRIADDGTAVLLAEQSVAHARAVADKVLVLHRGRLRLAGKAADLSPDRIQAAMISGDEPG